jgi:hypothetical protein
MTTPIIVKRDRTIQKPIEVLWTLIEPAEGIYPANFIKGLLIRLIAKPRVDMAIKKSLEILSV